MTAEVELRPGDVVAARRFGLFWHWGVYEGPDSVIVLHRERGVCRQDVAEFAAGREFRRIDGLGGSRLPHSVTLARARRAIGRGGYDLLQRNCEHFARWCATGNAQSRQVDNARRAALLAAAVPLAVTRLKLLAVAGVLVGAFALGQHLAQERARRLRVPDLRA